MSGGASGIGALIGGSAAIFLVGAFVFSFPGVMGSYWQELFQAGRGAIGQSLFFVLVATGIFMFFVGRWQERFGARRMVTIGVVLCSLDTFFIAAASNLTMLYVWAFVMGVASCFVLMPALTSVQRWFPARRGLVSGIVNFVFGFSAAVMSPLFAYMLQTIGYGSMNLILGIAGLVVGLVAARFVEMPPAPDMPPPQTPAVAPAGLQRSLTVRESVRTSSFWFLWITWALQGAASIAMVTLSTQYGLARGFDLSSAVIVLTAFNVTSGLSRLVVGWLSDVVGRRLTMSASFLAAGCAYFLLPYAGGIWSMAALAAAVGCGFGTLFAVSAALTSDCFGLVHFGAIYGLIFTAYGSLSGILGPGLSGYLLDATGGDFSLVFGYLGMFSVVAAVSVWFVRRSAVTASFQ